MSVIKIKAFIASMRANLATNEVKITLSTKLTPELHEAIQYHLGWWSSGGYMIDVSLTAWQDKLPGLEGERGSDGPAAD